MKCLNSKYVFLIYFLLISLTSAGTYNRTSFTVIKDGYMDSSLTTDSYGLRLDLERWDIVKMYQDASLDPSSFNNTYSDVVCRGQDAFTFFWADTADKKIYKRDVNFPINGTPSVSSVTPICAYYSPLCSLYYTKETYLHAQYGKNGYLLAFQEKASGLKTRLMIHNGFRKVAIDSSPNFQWVYPSMCQFNGDTFLIVNSVDYSKLTLRKIYSYGSTVTILDEVRVATGAAAIGQSIMNCSVAYDGGNNILVTWTQGTPSDDKYLYYRVVDKDLNVGNNGMLGDRISYDNTKEFRYYDDAPCVSYAQNKFAVATWDQAGIMLHRFDVVGGVPFVTSNRIVNKSGPQYCAVATNKKQLVVVCKGDLDGNGKVGIEGYRYPINSFGNLGVPQLMAFSDTSFSITTSDRYSTAINCDMDTMGSLAFTWRHAEIVKGCAWANRGILHRRGYWTSPPESLNVYPGDSVRYFPATVTVTDLSNWSQEDSIRTAVTPGNFNLLNPPWTSLSTQPPLDLIKTDRKYFQIRLALNRRGNDSLTSPAITRITFPWDAQPKILSLDSVSVNERIDTTIHLNDTLTIFSRSDSVVSFLTLRDADPSDRLTLWGTPPARNTVYSLTTGPIYNGVVQIPIIANSNVILPCSLKAYDLVNWQAVPKRFFVKTRNSVPLLSFKYVKNGSTTDTVPIQGFKHILLQEEDSITFLTSVQDTNDQNTVKAYFTKINGNSVVKIDSTLSNAVKVVTLHADTSKPTDSLVFSAIGADRDISVRDTISIWINHKPVISNFSYGNVNLRNNDTIRVLLFNSFKINVAVQDTDVTFWDTLTYVFKTKAMQDTVISTANKAEIDFVPNRNDSLMTITVHDRFGRSDSVKFFLKFPWFDTTSQKNPMFKNAIDSLATRPSLVIGSKDTAFIEIPILNSGNDTMSLNKIKFKQDSRNWLWAVFNEDSSAKRYHSRNSTELTPFTIAPDSILHLKVYYTVESLNGDGIVYDTIVITTSDPSHLIDTIRVRLEYNDLPQITNIYPKFNPDEIYRPRLSKAKSKEYVFPPHAKIQIHFTEPIDSISAFNGVYVYSVLDSLVKGSIDTIPLEHVWSQNYTSLELTPVYNFRSPKFGIFPLAGLFIPTDSIHVVFTTGITDRAQTPSGPNKLDVNLDHVRDISSKVLHKMKIDSINFHLVKVTPGNGEQNVSGTTQIALNFSDPLYGSSIDTSLIGNRSLIVRSRYNKGQQLSFSNIEISGGVVTFTLTSRLYFKDSVWCYYRAVTGKDRLGFPSDNTNDGLPQQLFDTLATSEDVSWHFTIRDVKVVSVKPDSGSMGAPMKPTITLTLSDRIYSNTFDTDTSALNNSFRIKSLLTGNTYLPFDKVMIHPDSLSVSFQCKPNLFAFDSVQCQFLGFNYDFDYSKVNNIPDSTSARFNPKQWFFIINDEGFYTFPNPYKPGKNIRHRQLGGIWFKNLHIVGGRNGRVRVVIYSMKGHPIYDSYKKQGFISYEQGNPQAKPEWFWDTRNESGQFVSSGIFFYAIFSDGKKPLFKGKLMIVR